LFGNKDLDAKTIEGGSKLVELLIKIFDEEINKFHIDRKQSKNELLMRIGEGYGVNEVIDIIIFIVNSSESIKSKLSSNKLFLKHIINDLLIVRRYAQVKNQHFHDIEVNLSGLLQKLQSDVYEDKSSFLLECASALVNQAAEDLVAQSFLIEQIHNTINPPKPIQIIQLILEKKRSQEEYIKGSMKKNPYLASEIGTTMKHIRTKLYKDLELSNKKKHSQYNCNYFLILLDFEENDCFLELLVADQIVSVDLPISLVYEKVWISHIMAVQNVEDRQDLQKDIPPMKIIYRIAGFEGEATENRVDNLVDDNEGEQDLEKKFSIAKVLTEEIEVLSESTTTSTIGYILDKINKSILGNKKNRELLKPILDLLLTATKIKAVRRTILDSNGVAVLIKTLIHFFPSQKDHDNNSIVEDLLFLLESVVTESSSEKEVSNKHLLIIWCKIYDKLKEYCLKLNRLLKTTMINLFLIKTFFKYLLERKNPNLFCELKVGYKNCMIIHDL
jgi:E3 ubiquitin-protein ligase UBR4